MTYLETQSHSPIESKCKEYGCLLLVGEATYKATKDDFCYLKVDDLQVKGKSVGLSIYTVLDDPKHAWRTTKRYHDDMHTAYRAKKFDEAIWIAQKIIKHFDGKMEGYYNMWIERCEYMKTQELPDDWNGVFIASLSNLFRTKVDHELEEFCYNLEYRVKDLKKRIADLQIIVNGKHSDGRIEPKLEINKASVEKSILSEAPVIETKVTWFDFYTVPHSLYNR